MSILQLLFSHHRRISRSTYLLEFVVPYGDRSLGATNKKSFLAIPSIYSIGTLVLIVIKAITGYKYTIKSRKDYQ